MTDEKTQSATGDDDEPTAEAPSKFRRALKIGAPLSIVGGAGAVTTGRVDVTSPVDGDAQSNETSANTDSNASDAGGAGASATEPFIYPTVEAGDDWQAYGDTIEMDTAPTQGVAAKTAGRIYADTTASDIAEIVPGELSSPLNAAFAMQVNVYSVNARGSVASWVGDATGYSDDEVISQAAGSIRSMLDTEFGITNLEAVSEQTPTPEQASDHREFRGRFELSATQSVTLPDGTTTAVELTGHLPINVFLSAWEVENSDDYVLGGGVYPGRRETTLQGPITSGLTAEISIDLGTDPSTFRQRLIDVVERTSGTT